jgi:cellobiose-specific phosphotransferase system component IIC
MAMFRGIRITARIQKCFDAEYCVAHRSTQNFSFGGGGGLTLRLYIIFFILKTML